MSQLTDREQEVARLVSQGFTNQEIGRIMQISHHTVKNHIVNIMHKTNLRNRTELAVKFLAELAS